jgi:hypothetical protein
MRECTRPNAPVRLRDGSLVPCRSTPNRVFYFKRAEIRWRHQLLLKELADRYRAARAPQQQSGTRQTRPSPLAASDQDPPYIVRPNGEIRLSSLANLSAAMSRLRGGDPTSGSAELADPEDAAPPEQSPPAQRADEMRAVE